MNLKLVITGTEDYLHKDILTNAPVLTNEGRSMPAARLFELRPGGHVDLYINVRVTNGHPKALDTILRVRFTIAYHRHLPSALNTWNTRASTAASGVINSGVVGDAEAPTYIQILESNSLTLQIAS